MSQSVHEQLREIAEFVDQEARTARKGIRIQLIMAAIVVIIIGGYFAFLNYLLKRETEPKRLAGAVVSFVDHNMPDFGKMVDDIMKQSTPKLASFVSKKLVHEGVPFLVKKSEKLLDTYVDELSKSAAGYMDKAVGEVIQEHKAELAKSLDESKAGRLPGDEAMRPLREKLHARFLAQKSGPPSDAQVQVRRTLVAMQNLNKRLRVLITKNPSEMTRKEQLSYRILQRYWMWLKHRKPGDVETTGDSGADAGADSVLP